MRTSRTVAAGAAAATALAVLVAGCGGHKAPSPASTTKSGSATSATSSPSSAATPSAQPSDYSRLLIQPTDIDAPEQFTASPPTNNPNGQPGVATTFSTQDGGHVIIDTIQVLADPAAATDALNAAKGAHGDAIKSPESGTANVGTGAVTLSGNAPDHSKGVLILLFTEGRAFVTMEFRGPVDSLPPQDFVNGVGGKQDAAIKKGLGG